MTVWKSIHDAEVSAPLQSKVVASFGPPLTVVRVANAVVIYGRGSDTRRIQAAIAALRRASRD